jgi:hypothetical protein
VIGGAATYAWLQKNGDAGDLHRQVEGAINKARGTLSDDTAKDPGAQVRDKANDFVDDEAERVEEATA